MKGKNSTNPTPPVVPSVDRVSGKITPDPRAEYGLDGWEGPSEDPFEGGLNAVNGFNDAMPEKDRAKAVAEFNQKPSNRLI